MRMPPFRPPPRLCSTLACTFIACVCMCAYLLKRKGGGGVVVDSAKFRANIVTKGGGGGREMGT